MFKNIKMLALCAAVAAVIGAGHAAQASPYLSFNANATGFDAGTQTVSGTFSDVTSSPGDMAGYITATTWRLQFDTITPMPPFPTPSSGTYTGSGTGTFSIYGQPSDTTPSLTSLVDFILNLDFSTNTGSVSGTLAPFYANAGILGERFAIEFQELGSGSFGASFSGTTLPDAFNTIHGNAGVGAVAVPLPTSAGMGLALLGLVLCGLGLMCHRRRQCV